MASRFRALVDGVNRCEVGAFRRSHHDRKPRAEWNESFDLRLAAALRAFQPQAMKPLGALVAVRVVSRCWTRRPSRELRCIAGRARARDRAGASPLTRWCLVVAAQARWLGASIVALPGVYERPDPGGP